MPRVRSRSFVSFASLASLALLLPLASVGCGGADEEDTLASEHDLVASFDKNGAIDLPKTSHILLVGDSDQLAELPLYSATTRARRYAQLYPNDQVVLFVTEDAKQGDIASTGASAVTTEPFGRGVAVSDLRRLSTSKLIEALDRFKRIASIDFFGHSSPFGALLEKDGGDRVLGTMNPGNIANLKDNFARDANPYVTFNGCNSGGITARDLSKVWEVPVSGALTGSNFQVLMSDGRWYFNDPGFSPPGTTVMRKNDKSFGPALTPACSTGSCVRMKPQDSPYRGVWARPDTGFQYGLNYYKFFCNFADADTCSRGMAASIYAFASTQPIDKNSTDADVKEVLADFFCSGNADPTWFDKCRTNLFAAAASGAPFSPMKGANDYTHECDFNKCEQQLRCDEANGAPQKKTCFWAGDASCPLTAKPDECHPKNTKKQTTNREFARYLTGHKLLRGTATPTPAPAPTGNGGNTGGGGKK